MSAPSRASRGRSSAPSDDPRSSERRRRVATRAIPIAVMCAFAFLAGAIVGARHRSPGEQHAERFAQAWTRGDYAAMYAELGDTARRRIDGRAFAAAYAKARATATATAVRAGEPVADGNAFRIPVRVSTRAFGTVRGDVVLLGGDDGIAWSSELVFPGLRSGEELRRTTTMPPRAAILARDKTPLAEGDERTSPLGALAGSVVGGLGPIPDDRRERLTALGVPADAEVGTSGLERVFDDRLVGQPGGQLLADTRVLARRAARPAAPVRTTISVDVQRAAVDALAGRFGGVVALNPRTGEVLAFAGIAFSGLQPPGSTFKIITATAALEAGLTSIDRSYPVETKAVLSGVELQNANGESCGGTLLISFAHSCNSVFAPLGARLGAAKLVDAAGRFGFGRAPDIAGAATSTIPPAAEIGDELAVGSTAIGQGRVQATALQMASVAATIGLRGRRPALTLDLAAARDGEAATTRVTTPKVARTVERMMLAVVRGGTGTAAAIAGTEVAGKTGTAELRTTTPCEPDPEQPESCTPEDRTDDPTDTDAWFAAYAPAGNGRPRVAVGVLLVSAGAGGDTAAPAARGILVAALQATS